MANDPQSLNLLKRYGSVKKEKKDFTWQLEHQFWQEWQPFTLRAYKSNLQVIFYSELWAVFPFVGSGSSIRNYGFYKNIESSAIFESSY